MRKKIYSIPIVLILVINLCMAAKQFIANSHYGIAHHDGRDLNKAIGYLEKCVAMDSKKALFRFSLGRAYLRKGLAETANRGKKNKWVRKSIDEFHRAVELEPSNSDYHFHLGRSFGCLAYPPPFYWKVIHNSFKRAAILNPTDVRHLYSMGLYYLNEYRRFKEVNENREELSPLNYAEYETLSRDNYQLYFRKLLSVNEEYLGRILEKCFSVTQEYTDLKGVARDVPNDHAFLARFLNRKGLWEESKKEFQLAIELEPTNTIHYVDYAHALSKRGCHENAIYWWQKLKALDPRDERPYLLSANEFVNLKRFDEALGELHDLGALYPRNSHYRLKLIETLLAAQRVDEAINEYAKMIGEKPHFSKATYDTICHYQKKGNYTKVIRILKKALSSDINN
jgi:tetratricopeptide (TPR) repeat protein